MCVCMCVIGGGVDIDTSRRDIVFGRRRQRRNINIPINDDDIFEPLESVTLSIRIPRRLMGMGISLGLISEAIGNIIDDEGIYISLDKVYIPLYPYFMWCFS